MPRSLQVSLLAASIAASAAACLSAGDIACTSDSECLQGESCDSASSRCMPDQTSGSDSGTEAPDAGMQLQAPNPPAHDAGTVSDAGTQPDDAGTLIRAPWALLESRTTVTRVGRTIDVENRTAAEVLAKLPGQPKCAKAIDECCFTTTPPEPELRKSLNAGTIEVMAKGTKGSLKYEIDSGAYPPIEMELQEGEKFAGEAGGGPGVEALGFPSSVMPKEPQITEPEAALIPATVSVRGFDLKWEAGSKGEEVLVGISEVDSKSGRLGASVRCRTPDVGGYRMEKLLDLLSNGAVAITVERAIVTEEQLRDGTRQTRGATVSRIGATLK